MGETEIASLVKVSAELAEKHALHSVAGEMDFSLKFQPKFFKKPNRGDIARRGDPDDPFKAENGATIYHHRGSGLEGVAVPPVLFENGEPYIDIFQGLALEEAAEPDRRRAFL